MTSKKVTDLLLFGIGLLQIFESEANASPGESGSRPPATWDPYQPCFDIDEALAKSAFAMGHGQNFPDAKTKCAYHAEWARVVGQKDPALKSWYSDYDNMSNAPDITTFQCMLWSKSTYPPWTELESHNCSFPCKAIYLLHSGESEWQYRHRKQGVICKGPVEPENIKCIWSPWTDCTYQNTSTGERKRIATRKVLDYDEGCLLTGTDPSSGLPGTLRDYRECNYKEDCCDAQTEECGPDVALCEPSTWKWWLWLLIFLLLAAVCLVCYYYCKAPPKKRATRKIKEVIEETPPPVPPPVPVRTTSYVLQPATPTFVIEPRTVMKPVTKKVQKQVARVVYETVEESVTEMQAQTVMTTAQSYQPTTAGSYYPGAAPIASGSMVFPASTSYAPTTFDALDKNHDGSISRSEFAAAFPASTSYPVRPTF